VIPAVLSACSVNMLPRDTSVQNRIGTELAQAAQPTARAASAVTPASVSNSLLPPLRPAPPRPSSRQLEQRFNLKVHDAPIGQVLLAIVQDTPYSVLLSPRAAPPGALVPPGAPGAPGAAAARVAPPASELLTVNLKDVTVFEALDAIREMYGYEYTVDGTRIYVQPPEMRTKLYQVNYINSQRRGVSDVQVVGGASTGTGSSGSGVGGGVGVVAGGGSSYASTQATGLTSMTKSDVWGEMEDGLRTVLGCLVARTGASRAASTGGAPGSTTSSTTTGGGSRADVSFPGETQTGERLRGAEGCPDGRAVIVSPMGGTVVVRALPSELRQVEALLRSLQLTIERQVIIEAKVVDVELNADSQQGVNWAALNHGLFKGGVGVNPSSVNASGGAARGTIDPTTTLGDLLGTQLLGTGAANAFSAGLGIAVQATNFSALINFLESQGNVHVLSSPRIATLNNQKAVLKVGAEESFVTNISSGSSVVTNGTAQTVPPTLTYQPFFSGISLDVTPQIDENDNITLHVRTMVNNITEKQKLALPAANSTLVPFAVNNISETDSVVKTRDSQVVVIGGLMTETTSDSRNRVPVAGDVPVVGSLFGHSERATTKRELVILLKPTVVKGDETWNGEIGAAQRRIEKMETTPIPGLLPAPVVQ
jgi:MSHA biogenesis protein MshL